MKIPKKIKIGAINYKVKRSPVPMIDNQLCFGTHSGRKGIIKITNAKDISKKLKENALIHEVIHAIVYNRDIGLNEHQVDNLSNGIQDIFTLKKRIKNK